MTSTTSLPQVAEEARSLWRGDGGYVCKVPGCFWNVYGSGVDRIHAHLLEHLVEMIRSQEKR